MLARSGVATMRPWLPVVGVTYWNSTSMAFTLGGTATWNAVTSIVSRFHSSGCLPLPKLIQLRPVAPDNVTLLEGLVIVAGKHISEDGLSFFHPAPLPYRLVSASLEKSDGGRAEFLLDVDWCRFTQLGWYESGGKFVRK